MAVQFATKSIDMPRGTGRKRIQGAVTFRTRVITAAVALNGFKLDFLNDDHHVNIVEADVDIDTINVDTVVFTVECNYADKNFDDPYQGYVTVLVIAEVQ